MSDYIYEIEGMKIQIETREAKSSVTDAKRLSAYKMTAIRNITGMNRKDFAKWLDIPYRTISDWENGKRQMPDYVLRLIAYKVRIEYIEKGAK